MLAEMLFPLARVPIFAPGLADVRLAASVIVRVLMLLALLLFSVRFPVPVLFVSMFTKDPAVAMESTA